MRLNNHIIYAPTTWVPEVGTYTAEDQNYQPPQSPTRAFPGIVHKNTVQKALFHPQQLPGMPPIRRQNVPAAPFESTQEVIQGTSQPRKDDSADAMRKQPVAAQRGPPFVNAVLETPWNSLCNQ